MILKAVIEEHEYSLNVPDRVLQEAEAFFAKLDADMDGGWQMSRDWVSKPNQVERCQIVANKLLTALEKENQQLGVLMAGYILSRMPGVQSVEMDTRGEIQNTQFTVAERPAAPSPAAGTAMPDLQPEPEPAGEANFEVAPAPKGMSKLEAMEQAGSDVTKVFKVGKGYRFSVFDHGTGQWQESPLIATEAQAENLRQQAFKARFESLQRAPH